MDYHSVQSSFRQRESQFNWVSLGLTFDFHVNGVSFTDQSILEQIFLEVYLMFWISFLFLVAFLQTKKNKV